MTIVLLVLLLLIVGGGLATWLVLYQPFTVAGVTQPQQTFSNTQMGVSLQYPRGWTARVEPQKSTAHLADSSQTARFTIVFTPTSGGDVNKYLQQEAARLTMTALKPEAAQTFAGTSWQQLQGNVLINGASYTETLFATSASAESLYHHAIGPANNICAGRAIRLFCYALIIPICRITNRSSPSTQNLRTASSSDKLQGGLEKLLHQ